MWNTGLDESQAGIKIARRNNNNLRYADDTTLMAENKEKLKSLLISVKGESEKAALKLNIHTTKIMASSLITSWQVYGGKVETVANFIYLCSKFNQKQIKGKKPWGGQKYFQFLFRWPKFAFLEDYYSWR